MASKALQSTIEISGVLSPTLQAAINNAVSRLEDMSKETLETAGAAERLTLEIDAQESVLKNLQRGYANYVASGQESSEEAQTLARNIQDLSGELDENKETLEAAEKAAQRLTETQDDSADAYSRLERTISDQQDELAALQREYANVVLEQGKTSTEAKALEGKISSLSGELDKNEDRLREVGEAAEEAGRKAEDSSDGYTILKDVIADLAADAISSAVDAFKELATEGDTALAMLEARTGATGDTMAGFEDILYEVYNANYGDSLGDVSDTLSTVIQMTDDLDDASLAQITKNSIALSDVFGFDTTESLRAVNSLMDQFGITSDEAYNLIVQGAQNGLNQNDDLLDTINEYAVQFKDAGYSADDMFNMLKNGTETGTWSVDKLGDAVKEFNIRMSDGTANEYLEQLGVDVDALMAQFEKGGPEAQKAIGTVMDAILGCDDATLQYQAGVGLFGTMWEDLGADTVSALMDTQGEISKTSDAMSQMDSAAYDTLESSLSQLGRTVKSEVVQPIADRLVPVAKSAVEFVTNQVGPAVDWILGHLPEIGVVLGTISAVIAAMKWGSIVAKVQQVIGVIKGVIAALAGVSAPVWAVIAIVAVLAAAFVNLWKNNEDFRNKITEIWEGIKSKFQEFGQGITDRLNALGFDFENFGEVIGAAWDAFCNLLAPVFEGVFQQISNILGAALDILTGIFDIFAGIFTGDWDMVWTGIQEVFGAVWDFLVSTFQNYLDVFTGIADVVLGWFGTSWEEVWSGISTFFSDTWNGIVSFFSETWTSISTTFSDAWTSITTFLSDTWETIKNVVQVGVMFIGQILSAAFQIITLPFRFIWENCKETVLSVWTAIKDTIGEKIDAAKEKISAVTGAIKTTASNAWSAVSSAASEKWEAIKSTIGSKISAAKERVSAVTGTIKSVASSAWSAVSSAASSKWESIRSTISTKLNSAKSTVSSVLGSITSTISSKLSSAWSTVTSKFSSIYNTISSKMQAAKDAVGNAISALKEKFNFSWSLPKLKLPHVSITGSFSLSPPSVPKFSISWYKDGGILTQPTVFGAIGNTLLAGGEAGAEAVLPLALLWEKLESILSGILSGANNTGGPSDEGLTSKAGELLTLDSFSLGSLADGTNVVIYYDFSNFTWSPQIQSGSGENEDDLMDRLRAHEAEFFDWLEEFIQMREVAQYA